MSGQIAIFEGHKMPRRRKKTRSRTRRGGGTQRSRFGAAARRCSRIRRRRKGSFQACVKRMLKGGGTLRRLSPRRGPRWPWLAASDQGSSPALPRLVLAFDSGRSAHVLGSGSRVVVIPLSVERSAVVN